MLSRQTALSAQAFNCKHPGCSATYQRKEHLNRHIASHDEKRRLTCCYCDSTLARRNVCHFASFLLWGLTLPVTSYAAMSETTTQRKNLQPLEHRQRAKAAMLEKNAAMGDILVLDVSCEGKTVRVLLILAGGNYRTTRAICEKVGRISIRT